MPAMPRPLVGLAAAVLAAGLLVAPTIAYAEPNSTPTPETTVAAKSGPSSSQSPTDEADKSASPSATTEPSSAEPSPTKRSPTESSETSASPSTDSTTDPDEASPSPSADSTTSSSRRMSANAAPAAAAAAAAEESDTDQLQAQAVAAPAISLTKTASPMRVSKIGQVVSYRFVAANTGGVALENVAITDELEGLTALSCNRSGTEALQPGEAMTCTATLTMTQDWLDFGDIDNSATVFGDIVGDDTPEVDYVGANASARVTVDQRPSIALDASVSPTGTADAGDRLRYRATATNTGNVTLRGARITSSLDALDLDCDPSAPASLSPGESISCTGSYKVSNANARRGRVSNELTARATGPYDDQRVSDDDTLRTKVTKPASTTDLGLADTGGPDGALPVGVLGVAALIGGAGLLRRSLRS